MITLERVTKSYPMGEREYRALRGVDLEIDEGEFVAISGASGSGKSTLLHLIGALHRPTSGRIFLEGDNLSTLSRDSLARIRKEKIGFVFQQYFLLSRATAQANVELPLAYAGTRRKDRQERARVCLDKVGLLDFADHFPTQLSGGECQRVAIARALANDPRLLLADEPTGNLDTENTSEIMDIVSSLHEEGRTIIVVTHEHDVAARAARRITLRDGLIEEDTDATF